MSPQIQYRQAVLPDLKATALLFDLYRQFYGCESDLQAAEAWLTSNVSEQRSVVLLAVDEASSLLGCSQL